MTVFLKRPKACAETEGGDELWTLILKALTTRNAEWLYEGGMSACLFSHTDFWNRDNLGIWTGHKPSQLAASPVVLVARNLKNYFMFDDYSFA